MLVRASKVGISWFICEKNSFDSVRDNKDARESIFGIFYFFIIEKVRIAQVRKKLRGESVLTVLFKISILKTRQITIRGIATRSNLSNSIVHGVLLKKCISSSKKNEITFRTIRI